MSKTRLWAAIILCALAGALVAWGYVRLQTVAVVQPEQVEVQPVTASHNSALPVLVAEDVELEDGLNLPVFSSARAEDAEVVAHINDTLQKEILSGKTLATLPPRDEREDFVPEFLNYQVTYPVPRILFIHTRGEGCGAYCSGFEKSYTFELKTGRLLKPNDIFTEPGLRTLLQAMTAQKKEAIDTFVAKAKKALPSVKDVDERAMLEGQIAMYPECFTINYDSSDYVFESDDIYDWLNSATSTTFVDGPCFNHATQAWDELGEFTYTQAFGAIADFLTPLGKELFLKTE